MSWHEYVLNLFYNMTSVYWLSCQNVMCINRAVNDLL